MVKLIKLIGSVLRGRRNNNYSLDRIEYLNIQTVTTKCKPRNNSWGMNSYFK